MRKYIFYPLFALLLGICGAFLSANGLPAAFLPALCIAAGVLFFLAAWNSKNLQGGALYTMPCAIRAACLLGCTAAVLLTAVLQLKTVMEAHAAGYSLLSHALELILILLAVPTVISTAFLAQDAKTGRGRSHDSLTVLFPVFYLWLWLTDVYRTSSSNPILREYVFLLLAVVFLLLAAQSRAGFSFGDGKAGFTVFTCLYAIFFAPLALLSASSLPVLFLIAGMTLYTVATLTALLRNQPMPDFPAPESEPETEVPSDE